MQSFKWEGFEAKWSLTIPPKHMKSCQTQTAAHNHKKILNVSRPRRVDLHDAGKADDLQPAECRDLEYWQVLVMVLQEL